MKYQPDWRVGRVVVVGDAVGWAEEVRARRRGRVSSRSILDACCVGGYWVWVLRFLWED
jgi:hypothetical protein